MPRRRSSPWPAWLKLSFALAVSLIWATAAVACPLCYEAVRNVTTVGQQLDGADRVVLARPVQNRFQIVAVLKGKGSVGDVIVDTVIDLDPTIPRSGNPYLLLHDALAAQWTNQGSILAEHADWLQQLAATALIKGDRPRQTWPMNMPMSSTLSYELAASYRACPTLPRKFRPAGCADRMG
jgi:hypothetical protein